MQRLFPAGCERKLISLTLYVGGKTEKIPIQPVLINWESLNTNKSDAADLQTSRQIHFNIS